METYLESSKQCTAMYWLRLAAQPTTPCAAAAAPHHVSVMVESRLPFLMPLSPLLLPAEDSLLRQTRPIASQARGFLGHLFPPPPLTSSASLLPTPSPRSLIMQNATVPACPGNYRLARMQLLSLVLKEPAFRPARLSPRPEPSRGSAHALNSISWP